MFQESVARVSQLESGIKYSQVTRELNKYLHWRRYWHENFPPPSTGPPLELRSIVRPRHLQPRPSRFFASVLDECVHLGGLRLSDLPGGRIVQIRRDEMRQSRYGRLEQRVRLLPRRSIPATYRIDDNGDEGCEGTCHLVR